MLSSRERMLRAIQHEEPDRVPVFEPYGVHPPTADVVLGRPCIATDARRKVRLLASGKVAELARGLATDHYELVKKLNFDAGVMAIPPTGDGEAFSRPRMIDENSWVNGDGKVFRMRDGGIPYEADSPLVRGSITAFEEHIKKLEEVRLAEWEEQLAPGFHEYEVNLGKHWKRLDVMVYTEVNGPAVPPYGGWYPLYLSCFHLRPDLMRRYLKRNLDLVLTYGKMAIDFGTELIFAGGDIADNHGPMLHPRHHRDFLLPVTRKITDEFHKRGAFVFNSSDGNLWPIADDYLVNSNVDGLMEIQVTAGMDLRRLKDLYGDRLCFNGTVDSQHTLVMGTPEQAAHETKQAIEILSPGGGHILSSSNSIHPGVKPQNYFAMLDSVRRFGKYPIRDM